MPEFLKQFGTLETDFDPGTLISHNGMVADAGQLVAFWRRCSLSSDFWSRYTGFFVAPNALPGYLNRESASGVYSYVLNELFENSAKFSQGPLLEVRYDCWVLPERVVFQLSNHILPSMVDDFAAMISQLLENDPEELYFAKLEENAVSNSSGSGLGYLTMIKDYGIGFGFGFTQVNGQSVRVDVQAQVSRKEI